MFVVPKSIYIVFSKTKIPFIRYLVKLMISGKKLKPVSVTFVITLFLILYIRSIDSHTIVVFCMPMHVDGCLSLG